MHKALRYGAKDMVNAFCQAFNFYPHTHTRTHPSGANFRRAAVEQEGSFVIMQRIRVSFLPVPVSLLSWPLPSQMQNLAKRNSTEGATTKLCSCRPEDEVFI